MNHRTPCLLMLLALGACTGDDVVEPSITPSSAALMPSMARALAVSGLAPDDVVWSAVGPGGASVKIAATGATATFTATSTAGAYVVTARSRREPDVSARATIEVLGPPAGALELSDPPVEGGLSGRFGDLMFAVVPNGSGAVARFTLASPSGAAPTEDLAVELLDERRVILRIGAVEVDGDGALTAAERDALASLVDRGYFPALAQIGLDAGCVGQVEDPRILAALLAPWQVLMKYFVPDRLAHVRAFADRSVCRHFTRVDEPTLDTRSTPPLPVLSNGRAIPAAYGFLPIDAVGALELVRTSAALTPDVDVYGPGNSMCRGACGADCEPNNCGEPVDEWRCIVDDNGHHTGEKQRWLRYTCGEHAGCIEHDACFDQCNLVLGVGTVDAGMCMRGCDLQAASTYGAAQGIEWALGNGPFTHDRSYDYRRGVPLRDEGTCPVDLTFGAIPAAGLAPHQTVLRWTGVDDGDPNERCRIEFGDGAPPVVVEPCAPSGEVAHTYPVPSEMRFARALYVATIHRVGADRRASAEVLATWRFTADPPVGTVPLLVTFDWAGFAGVARRLTCTLDFGDGSTPRVVDDCADAAAVTHTYVRSGVYTARITVRGEDRPVSKSMTIDVRPDEAPTSCEGIRDITSWRGTASFSYAASGNDGRFTIDHLASGSMDGTLTRSGEGPGGVSFAANTPGGQVTLQETATWLPSQRLRYRVSGSGAPLGGGPVGDTGSSIQLNFDLARCRFNVHVQAYLDVEMSDGERTTRGQAWVMAFQTPWLPIPAGGSLTGGGAAPAHSELWILTQPQLDDWYWIPSFDVVNVLGEDQLGPAQVQWSLAPGT